jgi:hypothetical protein
MILVWYRLRTRRGEERPELAELVPMKQELS